MSVNIFGSGYKSKASNTDKKYIDSKFIALTKNLELKVNKNGDTIFCDIDINRKCITNLQNPKSEQDPATKNYVNTRYFKNNVGFVPELISNDRNKSCFIV